MNKKSRAKMIYLNSIVTLFGQILQILLGFIVRKIFINSLGVEYLGYNSVFLNILQMLNLADLGIGVAITSFLYRPLAIGDKKHISTLMYIYKRIYNMLGIVIFILGIIFSMFLQFLIPDSRCSIWYLRILFYINLIGAVSTYYLAYKRTLLIADQKSYITSFIDSSSYIIMSIMQGVLLIFYPNYVIYLILTIVKNILSNFIISLKCNKQYIDLDKNIDKKLIIEYKPQIFTYVKDVFISRVGAYVYYSTDNIIISVFKGSLLAGYLSNYTLITTQVSNIIMQILSAIQATFGNYISMNDDIKKQKDMTDNYLCVNFCIGNVCMICTMFLIQPFVNIVFGEKFLLQFSTVSLLSINLLLNILIQIPSQIFTIYKLYSYDRIIVVISASLNIIVSTVLIGKLGINGVLIGTTITSLVYLFSRFFIVSKYVYKISYLKYMLKFFRYGCVVIVSIIFEYVIVVNMNKVSVTAFGIRMLIVGIASVVIPTGCLIWTKEFQFLKNKLVPNIIRKKFSNWQIEILCIVILIILVCIGKYS